jgi:hypothetical protein
MKKITNSILALCAVVMLTAGSTYASFPVKSDSKKEVAKEQVSTVDAPAVSESTVKASEEAATKLESANSTDARKALAGMDQEKIIILLLWFFLGGLAAHRWYVGKPVGWNILFILTAGGCGIWAIVDLVNILTDKF